jgi:hypothetical protein
VEKEWDSSAIKAEQLSVSVAESVDTVHRLNLL